MNKQLELPTSPRHFILLLFNESKIASIAKCASVISCALKGSGEEKKIKKSLFESVQQCSPLDGIIWLWKVESAQIFTGEKEIWLGSDPDCLWSRVRKGLIFPEADGILIRWMFMFPLMFMLVYYIFYLYIFIYHSACSPEKIKMACFWFTDSWPAKN